VSVPLSNVRIGGARALHLVGALLVVVGAYSELFAYVAEPRSTARIALPPYGLSSGFDDFGLLLFVLAVLVVALSFGVFRGTNLRTSALYPLAVGALVVCLVVVQFTLAAGTEGVWAVFTTGAGFVVSLWGGSLLIAGSALQSVRDDLARVAGPVGALVALAVVSAFATFAFRWVVESPLGPGTDPPPQPGPELVSGVFVLAVVAGVLLCTALDARGQRRHAGQALFLGGVAAALVVLWRTNRPADRDLWWSIYYHMGPSVLLGVFAAFLLLVAGGLLWERSVDDSGALAPVSNEDGPGLAGVFGGALFLVATALAWSIRISGSDLHGEGLLELDRALPADALVSTVALGVVLVASSAFTDGLRRYAGISFLALGTAIAGLTAHVWGRIPPAGIALASSGEAIGPGVPVAVCATALLLTTGALLHASDTTEGSESAPHESP